MTECGFMLDYIRQECPVLFAVLHCGSQHLVHFVSLKYVQSYIFYLRDFIYSHCWVLLFNRFAKEQKWKEEKKGGKEQHFDHFCTFIICMMCMLFV